MADRVFHLADRPRVDALKQSWRIPALLGTFGVVLTVFSDSDALFWVVVFASSLVAFSEMYSLVTRPSDIRFSSTLALGILLGYAVGSLTYLLGNGTIRAADYQFWAAEGLVFTQSSLSMALSMTVLASAGLLLLARIERPFDWGRLRFEATQPKYERLVWLGVLVTCLAYLSGDIGYMGAAVSDTGHVSVLGSMVNLLVPPLVPYTGLLFAKSRSKAKKISLAIAILVLALALVPMGRRYAIYSTLLFFVALGLGGGSVRQWGIRRLILFAFAAFFLYEGSQAFMALRIAGSAIGSGETFGTVVRESMPLLRGNERAVVEDALAENFGSRPFILSYLAGLVQTAGPALPLYGGLLLYSIESTVPSLLMPSKVLDLPTTPEDLVHPYYGIESFDGPDSIVVSGFDDFGWAGAILYPLLLASLYIGFYRVATALISDIFIRAFITFALLFQLLYIEQGLATPFVILRNLVLLLPFCVALLRAPTVRLRRAPPRLFLR